MTHINPYLNFSGNTEEAFNFYKSVFGGEFQNLTRFGDTPEKDRIPAQERDKIMHIALPLGNGYILMATDALDSMGHHLKTGNNYHLSVETGSKEEADKIFTGLSAGGKITQPIKDQFWGAYFGSITDKYGINWMISYDKNRNN